jgi:hypothetical protein
VAWLVFSDKEGVGRHYWSEAKKDWVKLYDGPTLYDTEDAAQDVAASFLMKDPDLAMWRFSGIGVTSEVGQPWNRSLDKP